MNTPLKQTRSGSPLTARLPLWLKHRHIEAPKSLDQFTVQAPDKKTLFCRAAWTQCSRMADLSTINIRGKTVLAVQGADLPLLMNAWLTELTALCGEHHLIFKRFTIMEMSTTYLKAEAEGEDGSESRIQASRSPRLAQLPIITYASDQWTAVLAFDAETPT